MRVNRILVIGSDYEWSIERIYIKHLRESGIETALFSAQNSFYDYYNRSVFNKLLFRSGASLIYKRINEQLLKRVQEFQPEVIWVFKGMEVLPDTLRQLKKAGFFLVNYNPDSPFVFSGFGSGNRNITLSIGLYDLYLTYDAGIADRVRHEYGISSHILPFGVELSNELYERCTRQEEVQKLCFLGNPDARRVNFLEQLAEAIPVDVYGHDWKRFIRHPNITVFDPVYGDDFWKVLYRYRVQLNLMRTHNPASHNMRSFEIPAVGGIGLFPDTVDHRTYFADKKELFLFSDVNDCIALARQIIQLPAAEADNIRKNARERSVTCGYRYSDRTKQVLQLLEEVN